MPVERTYCECVIRRQDATPDEFMARSYEMRWRMEDYGLSVGETVWVYRMDYGGGIWHGWVTDA